MAQSVVGIIGGSGLYDLPGLVDARDDPVDTPWGKPSDPPRRGSIGGREVVFISRHGQGHRFSPSDINYRANIAAMKMMGVTDLISVSACGSYRAEFYPGFFVFVDQFVDRTVRRESSFFGSGCVAHVSMAHPVAPLLQRRLAEAATAEAIPHRIGGTYLCIEGPQFSSQAESLSYRSLGYDVVGMTAMPEAKLAREAELSYATVAMVTDFDCWHPDHDRVEASAVMRVVRENAGRAGALLSRVLREFPNEHEACPIGSDRALEGAIVTAPESRDPALVARLGVIGARVLA